MPDSERCIAHGDRVTDLAEWRKQGGKGKSNRARAAKNLPNEPMTTGELHIYLGVVFRKVINGTLEPGVATAAATVARTMAELAKASDYESRLLDLERRLTGRAS